MKIAAGPALLFRLVGFPLILLSFIGTFPSMAQGDGPRSSLPMPKGITGVSFRWMNMKQNFLPSGTIFAPDASVTVNVYPIALFQSFNLGGHLAQVLLTAVPGSTSGSIRPASNPGNEISFKASGLADGFIGFKYGLINMPALDPSAFAKRKSRFTLQAFLRYWYSGSYQETKSINMGTNRQTVQLSLPTVIPIFPKAKYPLLLELNPGIEIFSKTKPAGINTPIISQLPIMSIESFLTKNLTQRFWLGIGTRYYFGGETKSNQQPEGNQMNVFALGGVIGYQFISSLSANLSYGDVAWGYNNASVRMWRLSAIWTRIPKK